MTFNNLRIQTRVLFVLLILSPILWAIPGCKSFDEAIRPVIDNAPQDSASRLYVTGTKPYDESDAGNLQLNVWRINSDPFPDSVLVYTRVMDSKGNFISNLAPPYYTGSQNYKTIWSGLSEQIGEGGPEYEIRDFEVREFSDKDGIPFEISLTLDYSGSMGSNIKFLEDAAVTFINLKLPQDRISIIKFDNNPQLVVPPTESKEELITQYGRTGLKGFGGYTALYAAGKLGGDQVVNAPKDHPRALILFTDGEDNASRITSTQLYDFCKTNNVPVFAVAFGAVNREMLNTLAAGTGGKFYQTNDPKELEAIFKDIYLSLRNYYLISYKPPRVDGKHIVSIALNPPNSDRQVAATAEYTKYLGLSGGDVIADTTRFDNEVFFAYNSSELRADGLDVVRYYAAMMQKSSTMLLEVQGHTDSIGGEAYNDTLSQRRANAVKDALISMGIDPSRIRARGFGANMPISINSTEEGRQKNRRTEFRILRK